MDIAKILNKWYNKHSSLSKENYEMLLEMFNLFKEELQNKQPEPEKPIFKTALELIEENKEDTKRCYICGETKPLTEFSRDKYQKDGYSRKCRECNRIYQRKKYNEAKKEKLKQKYGADYKKRCGYCQQVKPAKDFHKRKSAIDGLQMYCKTCMAELQRKRAERYKKNNMSKSKPKTKPVVHTSGDSKYMSADDITTLLSVSDKPIQIVEG